MRNVPVAVPPWPSKTRVSSPCPKAVKLVDCSRQALSAMQCFADQFPGSQDAH